MKLAFLLVAALAILLAVACVDERAAPPADVPAVVRTHPYGRRDANTDATGVPVTYFHTGVNSHSRCGTHARAITGTCSPTGSTPIPTPAPTLVPSPAPASTPTPTPPQPQPQHRGQVHLRHRRPGPLPLRYPCSFPLHPIRGSRSW